MVSWGKPEFVFLGALTLLRKIGISSPLRSAAC